MRARVSIPVCTGDDSAAGWRGARGHLGRMLAVADVVSASEVRGSQETHSRPGKFLERLMAVISTEVDVVDSHGSIATQLPWNGSDTQPTTQEG